VTGERCAHYGSVRHLQAVRKPCWICVVMFTGYTNKTTPSGAFLAEVVPREEVAGSGTQCSAKARSAHKSITRLVLVKRRSAGNDGQETMISERAENQTRRRGQPDPGGLGVAVSQMATKEGSRRCCMLSSSAVSAAAGDDMTCTQLCLLQTTKGWTGEKMKVEGVLRRCCYVCRFQASL
jgi:hypothetical protein